jgi:hypothetical protein
VSCRRLTEAFGGQSAAANVDTLRHMARAASSSSRLTVKGRATRARIIDAAAQGEGKLVRGLPSLRPVRLGSSALLPEVQRNRFEQFLELRTRGLTAAHARA